MSTAILDPARMRSLRRVGGDRLVRELAGIFVSSGPRRVRAALDAERRADLPGVAMQAHSLLSSAQILGANKLAEACRELERATRSGDRRAVRSLLQVLRSGVSAVVRRLRKQRSARGGGPKP